MKKPEDCLDLLDIREGIDQIDHDIIAALGRRMAYVKAASRFKPDQASIPAPDRVAAMLPERARWAQENGLSPHFIEDLFSRLIQWYIAEQVAYWKRERAAS
ncbi:isochorismate lyase [Rhodospirillum sp. A1_3_36]|uniref:isochorismate lyase n=1 Tax=Rhodospirillum sp. A1_3_36 TaxID=3391666 RepID=UPI0039A775D1